jgi:pimeloyl-ACP methyl ester carboxylesterase
VGIAPGVIGGLVQIDDTSLFVEDRGDGYPMIVLHGGPGLDHHQFADHLDPLTHDHRLLLVDQRAMGRSARAPEDTWTLERHAQDVIMLARALRLERYAVLGHGYGALVALQNAVDYPGMAAQTIVSGGMPSVRFLPQIQEELARFEPMELRQRVFDAWAREPMVRTAEAFAHLWADQLPFHLADPLDPRMMAYREATSGMIFTPDVLRSSVVTGYGGIDVESRLDAIASPVLVLAGRHDRVCSVAAADAMAAAIPNCERTTFDRSGHLAFVEEPERYVEAIRDFLQRNR